MKSWIGQIAKAWTGSNPVILLCGIHHFYIQTVAGTDAAPTYFDHLAFWVNYYRSPVPSRETPTTFSSPTRFPEALTCEGFEREGEKRGQATDFWSHKVERALLNSCKYAIRVSCSFKEKHENNTEIGHDNVLHEEDVKRCA